MLITKFSTILWATALAAGGIVEARAKEHVPLSIWNRIFRYAAYQAAAYTSSTTVAGCMTPPYNSTLVQKVYIATTATQASIFRDDASKEFIVGFPGSVELEDYLFDALVFLVPFKASGIDLNGACKGCEIHTGFLEIWNSVSATLISTLKSQLKTYKGYTVTLTGHSLGAAIAAVGYASLKDSGLPVTQTYALGAPRCGNQAFADHIDKLSGATDDNLGEFWRITHADDIVPRAFPNAVGYQHSRTELWQMDTTLAPGGHTSPNMTYRCFGQEPTDCINIYGANITISSVRNHGYYVNQSIVGNYSCIGKL